MSNHTPSPWQLTLGKYDASIHTDVTIASVSDEASAWKANASLIAAAPKLLQVLQDILPEFIGLYERFDPTGQIAIWEQWTEEAMEAIAEAEGVNK